LHAGDNPETSLTMPRRTISHPKTLRLVPADPYAKETGVFRPTPSFAPGQACADLIVDHERGARSDEFCHRR
jgi:hypothetical protein